jgi:hypothetical protein
MSDQQLCDLLNEFYEDIRPDLAESVFSAIKAAQNVNEFSRRPEVFEALRRLILNLANPQQDDGVSINTYMSNNATRGSSTRPFFYNMTLPGNLNTEDNPFYTPPPAALPELRPSRIDDFPRIIPPIESFPLLSPLGPLPSLGRSDGNGHGHMGHGHMAIPLNIPNQGELFLSQPNMPVTSFLSLPSLPPRPMLPELPDALLPIGSS